MRTNSILQQINTRNAAQFILGKDVVVIGAKKWTPNKQITIQCWEVNYPEQQLPNQFGQIICPRINAEEIAVQLIYLKHQFTPKSTAVVYALHFDPQFLQQWNEEALFNEEVFSENNAGLQVAFSPEVAQILRNVEHLPEQLDFGQKLRQMEAAVQLLRIAIEHLGVENESASVPACSFLTYSGEREKVAQAKAILEEEFDQIIPIKELARRVAINECYLKKGFKAMFGKTINEFQQSQRIDRAKQLLQREGLTVSEVANVLGYSSISHFSTAFKKATNMKPCELLR